MHVGNKLKCEGKEGRQDNKKRGLQKAANVSLLRVSLSPAESILPLPAHEKVSFQLQI
jgi:hypothetical protein